ncbi:protein-tyrosine phosphatase mitochondrial 1-like [Saccoglossus kowalevskii]|uniref:Protein-tyrosine phosphatase mitochondrial 1-like n=1 Tax=Saccoglossus kowalevskii TaxID=10224 RepID=A0ABM0GGW3_SACKO|nr:protein-tyrosine phosphatase mitochondrial 1-like [Saccoglossus kowalevskii]
MGGITARVLYYPTLLFNVVMSKVSSRRWYDRIDSTVILGALPFRGITKQLVEDENVRAVITMNEEYETRFWVNNKEEWEAAGVEQLRLTTQDFVGTPSSENVNKAVDFIYKYKEMNKSVYIHCKAGRTRSATITACYLMKDNGWNPQTAYNFIKSKRSHIILRQKQWNTLEDYYQSINESPR